MAEWFTQGVRWRGACVVMLSSRLSACRPRPTWADACWLSVAWPLNAADLTVAVRQTTPTPGDLERALGAGEMVRSYAFCGGSYAFTTDIAALVLSVRTATRAWETRRWQQQSGFALKDWDPLREAVCDALAAGPMTRGELSARLARTPLAHLSAAATGTGADSLSRIHRWSAC